MQKLIIIMLLCLLMSACLNSPPNHYYLLSALPAETASTSAEIETLIAIGPVEVADYLNRLPLTYQQESGKLHIQSNSYWAEPLDKGIARVVGLNLSRLNQSRAITLLPTRTGAKPHLSVQIQVHELNTLNAMVHMNSSWQLLDNQTHETLLVRNFVRSKQVQANNSSMVLIYSELLIELATEMDHALSSLAK